MKVLEEEIGRPLFLRLHRALELTPEGHAVASSLQDAFERMSAVEGADNLEFLGFLTDMPAFYDTCDIVVLHSVVRVHQSCPRARQRGRGGSSWRATRHWRPRCRA